MLDLDQLRADIERDEGRRRTVYLDTKGIASIGIGRNIRDKGLSDAEIDFLFHNDVADTVALLDRTVPWWRDLPEPAARGLADMTFDLMGKVAGFHDMLGALQRRDGDGAAAALLDSLFARQTGARAQRIAELYRSAFR